MIASRRQQELAITITIAAATGYKSSEKYRVMFELEHAIRTATVDDLSELFLSVALTPAHRMFWPVHAWGSARGVKWIWSPQLRRGERGDIVVNDLVQIEYANSLFPPPGTTGHR